jgi:uncharacterized protein involved in type VI secretion and phage assembly
MTTTAVHVRDFDVRQPAVYVEAKAGEGATERFEFPANVLDEEGAKARAKARLEQLLRDELVAVARGDTMRPKPGFLLTVEGCADDEGNGEFLVVEVEHDFRMPTPDDEKAHGYECFVRMVRADARGSGSRAGRCARRGARVGRHHRRSGRRDPRRRSGPREDSLDVGPLRPW